MQLRIVGTSHIATQSVQEITKAIEQEKPQIIALELDVQRAASLWNKEKRSTNLQAIFSVGIKGYLFAKIGQIVQQKLGKITGISPGSEMKTAMEIAEVRGVLRYLAALAKTPVREYTPLEVKMALTGYGRAPKEQVQKMLKLLLKIKSLPKSDDACDALAIGITCAVCLANSRLANKL